VSEQATKPQEKALRPNQGLQLTASAGALKIAGFCRLLSRSIDVIAAGAATERHCVGRQPLAFQPILS